MAHGMSSKYWQLNASAARLDMTLFRFALRDSLLARFAPLEGKNVCTFPAEAVLLE